MQPKPKKNRRERFDTVAALGETAQLLLEAQQSIQLHGDGEHESTVAELARISTALVATCAELRQHAKAEDRALDSFDLEQIVAHLKRLPADEFDQVVRDLTGAAAEEPLL